MDKNYEDIIKKYFEGVCEAYKLGNIESSYYRLITDLFNSLGCAARDLSGERKGQSGENIDIKLWHSDEEVAETEPFSGIEAKCIGGIDKRAKEQIRTEANHYGYVILTDNAVWQFWHAGDTQMYAGLRIIENNDGKLTLNEDKIDLFFNLLEDFILSTPTQIKSSTKLAEYMAKHARTIRSIISGILRKDENGQPIVDDNQRNLPMFIELYGLYSKIKSELSPALDTDEFADMYAQTIVYGLFIARYNDNTPDTFDKYEAIGNLQSESELLKQFFMHIAASTGTKHPTLVGVIDKLCELYKNCDIQELLEKEENKDTIIHFYEEFLSIYDPKKRKAMGVFYTPAEAVRYLVRVVDQCLVNEFNIEGGLSNNDQITIKVPCAPYEVKKNKVSDIMEVTVPKVAILDPACGTGSFDSEIIQYVKDKYFSGPNEAFYESYITEENGLLSRLIAFEIMMTSYVVAHLKIRRTINSTVGHKLTTPLKINVFLTNTLSPAHSNLERGEQLNLLDFTGAITEEAYKADTWKVRRPVKVIIGNPPYLKESKNTYDISAYKTETDGMTDFGERKHWLNNDYVQFFRFAENIINNNREGVLAYVSSNTFLDNNTCRGMRGSLLRTFDKIYIINLHGDTNKKETTPTGEKDENIFEIKTGVSLFIGVKTNHVSVKWADVYYSELWGTKESKLAALEAGRLPFKKLTIDKKMAYFVPFVTDDKSVYEKGVSVTELFPVNVTGIVTGNDKVAIANSRDELVQRLDKVKNSDEDEIRELWGKFSEGQTAKKIKDDVLSDGTIARIAFRPFDLRWTYYTGNSCSWVFRPREKKTMGHLLKSPTSPIEANIGLVFGKTSRRFYAPFVSNTIIAHRLFSAMCEIAYIAPLYLYNDKELIEQRWDPNISNESYEKLTQYMENKPSTSEVFDYVYGVLHDPNYCERYNEFLCRDFPRVPIINVPEDSRENGEFVVSIDDFNAYVDAGEKLRKLHLLYEKEPVSLMLEPNNAEDLQIESVAYSDGVLKINSNKKINGIPEDVWNYEIGGYQVVDKWFKEHKGESLNRESFTHICNMVGALSKTIEIENSLKELHD